MSLPPLPGMGATTKEENYDKITAWANAVGALALNALPLKGALGTESLDTVSVPGIYFQGIPANALPSNGYPASRPGVLKVSPHGSGQVLQEYFYELGGYTLSSKRFKWGGEWNTWRLDAINRIDQTVGRAMYTWDNLNNREQVFYSDTGYWDITDTFEPKPVEGRVMWKRVGQFQYLLTKGTLRFPSGVTTITATAFAGAQPPFDGIRKNGHVTGVQVFFSYSGSITIILPTAGGSVTNLQVDALCRSATPTTVPGILDTSPPHA